MAEGLLTTPLHDEHVRLGGKMIGFAGFRLPVHYPAGIRAEHGAVRERAGLFDVSHMGEFEVSGTGALEYLQRVSVNDVAALSVGQAQYSLLCNEAGGVIDDLLVYRLGEHRFLLVVNAATARTDLEWLRSHEGDLKVELTDRSDAYALLALQGPTAASILDPLTDSPLAEIAPFHFTRGQVCQVDVILARTGYTGEDGFELFVGGEDAIILWRRLLEGGREVGLRPAGLGARDLLRLEMGYPLYGADLDQGHTALEAGLGWVVKLGKGDFVGRTALARQREEGLTRRLVGIRMLEKGFPRPGYSVTERGQVVGTLTSGSVSPSLGVGIAMAYLPGRLTETDTAVEIRIRDRDLSAVVARPPFYREGSRKR